ncbi:MAG: response regulator transcription factor [Anaerolineales bacterium]|nr:MAG: response regulator transcription factor [Anaerolineales bacterium]
MKPIRLVVVDDHALFRSGLISLLGGMPEFQVVGEAANGREAIEVVQRLKPDVVLLDVNMPIMGGVETVQALNEGEKCKIVMLTISKNDEDLFGAIAAGADGYLLKNASPEELCKAIMKIHEGMSVLAPDVTRQVMRAVSMDTAYIDDRGLSSREMEVLSCLAQGRTTAQISTELFISDNTVKTHVRHILEKLEASNRAEAVSKAIQLGLIGQE